MSHGHADKIARSTARLPSTPDQARTTPINPARYWQADLRAAIACHDFATVYRVLKDENELSQRQIATITGQSQSEVSEILSGRQVLAYSVLVRIVTGLAIAPQLAGVSWYGPDGTYAGQGPDTSTPKGVTPAMLRRHLIAFGGAILAGVPVDKVGELLDALGEPPPVSLPTPTQLSHAHVAQVRDLTRRLGEAGRTFGYDPAMSSAAAARAEQLLRAPGAGPAKRALISAVAETHIRAGWAAFDGGLQTRALYHYSRGLELATETADPYLQALALNCAGLATLEHGHPDDGLKMLQCAQVKTWDIPAGHDRAAVVVGEGSRAALQACGRADSATALASLGELEAAYRELGTARERWVPTRTDPGGDLDRPAALLELQRGRLDVAEQLAAASVRRWQDSSPVDRAHSGVVLATIHIHSGESDGPGLAHAAITAVSKLTSVRSRRRLEPLAQALVSRRGRDYAELARTARQVATT